MDRHTDWKAELEQADKWCQVLTERAGLSSENLLRFGAGKPTLIASALKLGIPRGEIVAMVDSMEEAKREEASVDLTASQRANEQYLQLRDWLKRSGLL